jgi:capsular polysaccharide export protein
VIKEHPLSIGRNSIGLIHRLTRHPNIRLVAPRTSSHDLIQRAQAVVVISSTVGLEALLYGRPVLTLGQPFYSGYGVTLDVDSFRELRAKVMEVLDFEPDRERILRFLHAAMRSCFPGAPVAIDPSEHNARQLAASLDAAAQGRGAARGPDRAVAPPEAAASASAHG